MKKLLLLEWLKTRKYKAFWILLALYVIAIICINLVAFQVQNSISVHSGGNIRLHLFSAPYLWNTTGWLSGFTMLLPGFLIIVLLTNEFSYRTLRQNIIEGLKREQAILSKWLLLFLLAIFCWLIYFAVTLVIGLSNNPPGTLFEGFQSAGYIFLKIILSMSVAFMLALWIKRSGLSIAVFLVYFLFIENLISFFLNKIVLHLGDFLPLSSGSELVPNPFERYIPQSFPDATSDCWFFIAGIGWIILFILLSVRYIRRKDL